MSDVKRWYLQHTGDDGCATGGFMRSDDEWKNNYDPTKYGHVLYVEASDYAALKQRNAELREQNEHTRASYDAGKDNLLRTIADLEQRLQAAERFNNELDDEVQKEIAANDELERQLREAREAGFKECQEKALYIVDEHEGFSDRIAALTAEKDGAEPKTCPKCGGPNHRICGSDLM